MAKLEREFNYYLKNQKALLEKFKHKYLVIKGEEVLGAYDSEIQAITETTKTYELGTFLVQKCEAGSDNYTQTYHSRVAV
jgi:hypothetical protein